MGGKGEARKEVDKKLAMARQDRNLRTMEPENSQIWIFSRHFLRSWCPFYLCYVFKIHFGSDVYCTFWDRQNLGLWDYRATFLLRSRAFAIWMCPVLVPSPVSTMPEFEVTWVGVWGYVGEVFAALESSHQRSHLPFTHSSGALPWLVSVIDTIFTSKAFHPNILLWTFSYICKKERKRKILQLQIQTCSCLENEPNTCFLATMGQKISLILFEGQ